MLVLPGGWVGENGAQPAKGVTCGWRGFTAWRALLLRVGGLRELSAASDPTLSTCVIRRCRLGSLKSCEAACSHLGRKATGVLRARRLPACLSPQDQNEVQRRGGPRSTLSKMLTMLKAKFSSLVQRCSCPVPETAVATPLGNFVAGAVWVMTRVGFILEKVAE